MPKFRNPHDALKHHVSGAIERGEKQAIAGMPAPQCDQCLAAIINGIFCHESGCPNQRKTWVPEREEWVRFVECPHCGCEVEEGECCDCQEPV